MNKINELKALIVGLEEDANKFYTNGTKAAGVRLRKNMQEIKALAQAIRLEISNKKNAE